MKTIDRQIDRQIDRWKYQGKGLIEGLGWMEVEELEMMQSAGSNNHEDKPLKSTKYVRNALTAVISKIYRFFGKVRQFRHSQRFMKYFEAENYPKNRKFL